jgi:hypothetical protein
MKIEHDLINWRLISIDLQGNENLIFESERVNNAENEMIRYNRLEKKKEESDLFYALLHPMVKPMSRNPITDEYIEQQMFSIICPECNGEGQGDELVSHCSRPVSSCCGGCTQPYFCDECDGEGSKLVEFTEIDENDEFEHEHEEKYYKYLEKIYINE